MTDVQAEWTRLSGSLGIDAGSGEVLWRTIVTAYGEPQRYYHTLNHIRAVVADGSQLRGNFKAAGAALLALFFHDIVYDPARHDNEEKSADLLRALLGSQIAPQVLDSACRSILATKSHTSSRDADTDLVIDIDMAIVGSPWAGLSGLCRSRGPRIYSNLWHRCLCCWTR